MVGMERLPRGDKTIASRAFLVQKVPMPLPIPLAIAIYITIWFTVLFAILPIGVRSQAEAEDVVPGTEPGAPVAPRMLFKAILTTAISAVVLAVLLVYLSWAK